MSLLRQLEMRDIRLKIGTVVANSEWVAILGQTRLTLLFSIEIFSWPVAQLVVRQSRQSWKCAPSSVQSEWTGTVQFNVVSVKLGHDTALSKRIAMSLMHSGNRSGPMQLLWTTPLCIVKLINTSTVLIRSVIAVQNRWEVMQCNLCIYLTPNDTPGPRCCCIVRACAMIAAAWLRHRTDYCDIS